MSKEVALSDLKILLVEDQEESRMIMRGILRDIGIMQVFEADDGRAGLGMVRSDPGKIDLIMCDWNMPVMSGLEFLRHARGDGVKTPFLMVTGRSDSNSVIEARKWGVNEYIRKPYSPAQVETKLRIMLQRMKAA